VQRKKVHKQRHSLAAPTRPAVKAARSQAHQLVLQQRAVRKAQLITAAAQPRRAPKHSRASSAAGAKSRAAVKGPSAPFTYPAALKPRDDISCRNARSFDEFRRSFYLRHRAALEGALGTGYGRRVTGIRLAPIASCASGRFMNRLSQLQPSECEVALAFHGIRLQHMQSICDRGLLVPNRDNGVAVANGSAYGVGIYTAREASVSVHYASAGFCSTIFACAVLTTGAVPYSYDVTVRVQPECISSNAGVFVLMQEARVCPLFLIDFEDGGSGGRSPPAADEPPFLPLKLIRALLRMAHTKSRGDGHRTAALLNNGCAAAY